MHFYLLTYTLYLNLSKVQSTGQSASGSVTLIPSSLLPYELGSTQRAVVTGGLEGPSHLDNITSEGTLVYIPQ